MSNGHECPLDKTGRNWKRLEICIQGNALQIIMSFPKILRYKEKAFWMYFLC